MEIRGGKWIFSGSELLVDRDSPLQAFLEASLPCEFPGSFLQKCLGTGPVFREPVLIFVLPELTLQCWDTTAEGPRGPPCAGSVKSRGFCIK